ncbi:MAG: AMP-dependent synthetase [Gammaproteobacteria bacterium HGW-Gammaproteobacteria-4]|nr:MAG: AMP-dependent synthetase [Gammaproteobacteria bacterium HGW-Gammaproteobacteria-4]
MSATHGAATLAVERPWLRHYGAVPARLSYPDATLYTMVAASAARAPTAIAWDFFDTRASYRALLAQIDRCADALATLGLRAGQRLLIAMPTTPQGVIAFYAANKLGAVAALIHPLSSSEEIGQALDATGARIVLTLDALYPHIAAAQPRLPLQHIVLARIGDYLSPLKRLVFWWRKGRMMATLPPDPRIRHWRALLHELHLPQPMAKRNGHDPAAILFSGGTTGLPKGIVLSNAAIIAEGMQAAAWGRIDAGDSILAILPIFHGFGLGVCVNAALMAGGTTILVPQFDAAQVARLLRRKRPSLLVGVPTLFEALSRDPTLARTDLSFLRAAFCGADTLPRPVKERFEALVRDNGGNVRLMEGYGLTEAVTAIMAMPMDSYREGSIGLPFPDMLAKICVAGTDTPVPICEEGEICIAGPALMLGYLDDPEATAATLRRHGDGRLWLHSGDLGRQDADGYFYFSVRLKRMIKSSGFNVYPAQVEAVLLRHPLVAQACVIGVPDPAQIERVQAVVVLAEPQRANEQTAQALIAWCREHLIKWSCPRDIIFRDSLPKTRVGKIDYRAVHDDVTGQRQT